MDLNIVITYGDAVCHLLCQVPDLSAIPSNLAAIVAGCFADASGHSVNVRRVNADWCALTFTLRRRFRPITPLELRDLVATLRAVGHHPSLQPDPDA